MSALSAEINVSDAAILDVCEFGAGAVDIVDDAGILDFCESGAGAVDIVDDAGIFDFCEFGAGAVDIVDESWLLVFFRRRAVFAVLMKSISESSESRITVRNITKAN